MEPRLNINLMHVSLEQTNRNTALLIAAKDGHKNMVEELINKGAHVNTRNQFNCTPLHLAAENGHKNVIEVLFKTGADLEAKNIYGSTPLHLTVEKDNKSMVEMLLDQGSNINAYDNDDLSPLHLANDKDMVKLLIDNGANINVKSSCGKTPLYVATLHGQRGVVEMLLKKGADINAKCMQGKGPLNVIYDIDCGKILIKYAILHNPEEKKPKQIIKNAELSDFWNDCKNQVEELLGTSSIPLYRFLQEKNENKLVGYLSNKNTSMRKELENVKKYHIYTSIISDQLNTVKKRECLLAKSNIVMKHCDLKKLPEEIHDQIVKSLTNSDLENFIKSAVTALKRKFDESINEYHETCKK